ncbi:hypothetical protein OCOL_000003 [Ordospora colligata]
MIKCKKVTVRNNYGLKNLPASIQMMEEVEMMDFENCGFTMIPEAICGMKTIDETDTSRKSYKKYVLVMKNLTAVDLTGNNIGCIETKVVNMLEKNTKLHVWLDENDKINNY